MDRYGHLLKEVDNAVNRVLPLTPESEHNMRVLMPNLWSGTAADEEPSPLAIVESIRTRLREKSKENVEKKLERYQFRDRLGELERSIRAATERRDRYHNVETPAPPDQQPVLIGELSAEDLTNARLRPARLRWLQELETRRVAAEAENEGLKHALQVRKQRIREWKTRIEPKVQGLETAAARLSSPHNQSQPSQAPRT